MPHIASNIRITAALRPQLEVLRHLFVLDALSPARSDVSRDAPLRTMNDFDVIADGGPVSLGAVAVPSARLSPATYTQRPAHLLR